MVGLIIWRLKSVLCHYAAAVLEYNKAYFIKYQVCNELLQIQNTLALGRMKCLLIVLDVESFFFFSVITEVTQ